MGLLFAIATATLCSIILSTLPIPTVSYWIACGCAGFICGVISRKLFD